MQQNMNAAQSPVNKRYIINIKKSVAPTVVFARNLRLFITYALKTGLKFSGFLRDISSMYLTAFHRAKKAADDAAPNLASDTAGH